MGKDYDITSYSGPDNRYMNGLELTGLNQRPMILSSNDGSLRGSPVSSSMAPERGSFPPLYAV